MSENQLHEGAPKYKWIISYARLRMDRFGREGNQIADRNLSSMRYLSSQIVCFKVEIGKTNPETSAGSQQSLSQWLPKPETAVAAGNTEQIFIYLGIWGRVEGGKTQRDVEYRTRHHQKQELDQAEEVHHT